MRERITYVHPAGGAVDPKSLDIQDTALSGAAIEAIREDKFTLSLSQLPAEISEPLLDLEELHLRWVSPSSHATLEPYCSSLSPGLHVSYTPLAKAGHNPAKLCALLQAFGLLDCTSLEAFTDMRQGRHGNAPALFFYQNLENLDDFAARAAQVICTDADLECKTRLKSLQTAMGLDVSFHSASETVKLSASWPFQKHDITISSSPQRRTEVGILGKDTPPALKPYEIGISGILIVMGQQKEPSTTLFSFPSRHRTADGSFSAKFSSPTGLHPALQLYVNTKRPGEEEDDECHLYAYLTLPKTIFPDRYQLEDELLLASKNLSATPYVSQPVDLEAPAYTTKTWGSNVLVKLARPATHHDESQTAEVPLHLRYLKPSQTGEAEVQVPYPVVFWACEADADVDFANNPFDRLYLGYDGLFPPSTVFWHVEPKPEAGTRLTNSITVPVLADEASRWVGLGTAAVVGLGFMWVVWKLLGVYSASGYGGVEQEDKDKKKQKRQK